MLCFRISLKVTKKGGENMDLGKRLKDLRGDRNRDAVAKAIGISPSALGMYECNKRIPRDDIKKRFPHITA